jgi:hypothetical protein
VNFWERKKKFISPDEKNKMSAPLSFQQQQYPNNNASKLGYSQSSQTYNPPCGIRRILNTESDRGLPPCAVIVTILEGSSYDDLYRHTPQTSPDPTTLLHSSNYFIHL